MLKDSKTIGAAGLIIEIGACPLKDGDYCNSNCCELNF